MSHEHNGDCCGQHEHEHMRQIVEQLGSMCCSGHCHHPEHQFLHQMLDEQHHMTADEEYDEFGVKRKKKKSKMNIPINAWIAAA